MFQYIQSKIMTLRNQFVLKVRTRDGKTHEVTTKREWPISRVKEHIRESLGKSYGGDSAEHFKTLTNESMRILCKGRLLNDEDIAGDHLSEDVVCHLVIRNQSPNPLQADAEQPAESATSSEPPTPAPSTGVQQATRATAQTQPLTNFLENMVREITNAANDSSSTGPVHLVFGAQSVTPGENATGAQASSTPQNEQPSQAQDNQSRRRPSQNVQARNVRRAIESLTGPSHATPASRLSDFNLPPVSSVHVHVHVSVDDLDRVAPRRTNSDNA